MCAMGMVYMSVNVRVCADVSAREKRPQCVWGSLSCTLCVYVPCEHAWHTVGSERGRRVGEMPPQVWLLVGKALCGPWHRVLRLTGGSNLY